MKRSKLFIVQLIMFFSIIGPGLITSIVDNDIGGIATSSLVGAEFGYSLLWVIIPLMVCLFVVQEIGARLALVTGKGLSDLIREQFGLKIAFWAMVSLFIANLTVTITQFTGVVVACEIFGLPTVIMVPCLGIFLFFLVVQGSYKRVEVSLLIGASLYLTYIISGFLARPDWGEIGKNLLLPSISWHVDYIGILIAIIGTNITPWMQFYQQAAIVDKGLKISHYKVTVFLDIGLGSVITMLVTFFIMVTTTATLFFQKIHFTDLKQAALALVPVAGQYAVLLFGLGLLATATMAILVIPLSTAYAITESFGWERGINKTFREAPLFYGILGLLILVGTITVLIPNFPYLYFIYTAQVINGMLLPVTLVLMLLLVNNKKLMGAATNKWWLNIIAGGLAFILILLSIYLVFQPLLSTLL